MFVRLFRVGLLLVFIAPQASIRAESAIPCIERTYALVRLANYTERDPDRLIRINLRYAGVASGQEEDRLTSMFLDALTDLPPPYTAERLEELRSTEAFSPEQMIEVAIAALAVGEEPVSFYANGDLWGRHSEETFHLLSMLDAISKGQLPPREVDGELEEKYSRGFIEPLPDDLIEELHSTVLDMIAALEANPTGRMRSNLFFLTRILVAQGQGGESLRRIFTSEEVSEVIAFRAIAKTNHFYQCAPPLEEAVAHLRRIRDDPRFKGDLARVSVSLNFIESTKERLPVRIFVIESLYENPGNFYRYVPQLSSYAVVYQRLPSETRNSWLKHSRDRFAKAVEELDRELAKIGMGPEADDASEEEEAAGSE